MMTKLNSLSEVAHHRPGQKAEARVHDTNPAAVKIETRNLSFYYGSNQVLFDVSMAIGTAGETARGTTV